MGADRLIFMPDRSGMAVSVILKLQSEGINAELADFNPIGKMADTVKFAQLMKDLGVGCIIAIGGDGTSRAVSKEIGDIPLMPISSGTNNAYPYMTEGTAGGIAAAGVASGKYSLDECCIKDKRIEIYVNDEFRDIALVDAVVTRVCYVGAKAVQNMEDVVAIVVTRCNPHSIGFSGIVGTRCIVKDTDNYGVAMEVHTGDSYIVPFTSGMLGVLKSTEPLMITEGQSYTMTADFAGSVALDGEREVIFSSGDKISLKVIRNGPRRILIEKTCETMLRNGAFRR